MCLKWVKIFLNCADLFKLTQQLSVFGESRVWFPYDLNRDSVSRCVSDKYVEKQVGIRVCEHMVTKLFGSIKRKFEREAFFIIEC